jgi:hypothetical protein
MNADIGVLSYIACVFLIAVYAWERSNTPPTNRSSTLRGLYWSSCFGYVFSALLLFAGLSFLLESPAMRTLFSVGDKPAFPAPLLATLVMTTLLQSVPFVKRVDSWLLSIFLDWGSIPSEVRQRAAALMPSTFSVTGDDLSGLRKFYDSDYGDTFPDHLRDAGSVGFEKSEYRFTRVAKLYYCVHRLAAEPRYKRFFSEAEADFDELKKQIDGFLQRAVNSLDSVAGASAIEGDAAYRVLMTEWHERFANDCRQNFIQLARFLARAVLRSEPGETEIVGRLRQIGFATIEPNNIPKFPLNSLTALGLCIFGYLVVTTIWFSARSDTPPAIGMVLAGKLTVARLASIALTVWLLQHFAFFRRTPGEQPRYFAYLVNGALGGLLAAAIWVLFRLGGDIQFAVEEIRVGLLSGMLCAAIAFCCDYRSDESALPIWVRLAEAVGCGLTMAAGTALIYFLGWAPAMPNFSEEFRLMTWIVLPSVMAMMIGACVPHIYREAQRAVANRPTQPVTAVPKPAPDADPPPPPAAPERSFDKAA